MPKYLVATFYPDETQVTWDHAVADSPQEALDAICKLRSHDPFQWGGEPFTSQELREMAAYLDSRTEEEVLAEMKTLAEL